MSLTSPIFKLQLFKAHKILFGLLPLLIIACSTETNTPSAPAELPSSENYTVLIGGTKVGYMNVSRAGDTLITDYDFKNNGRGPTIMDTIILNANGYPVKWDIKGTATFGNTIDEHFKLEKGKATWTDATGTGEMQVTKPSVYINQSGTPYSYFVQAKILLNSAEQIAPGLPGGRLEITEMEKLKAGSDSTEIGLTSYAISGSSLNPTYFILDENEQFFALISPRYIVIRSGFESEEKRLRLLSENYAAKRFENLQSEFAHKYEKDTRIANVRIFDPKTLSLTEPSSVLVKDGKISSIDAPDVSNENEIVIDGANGVLVPGLYEMHGHMGDEDALLNVLAGVTSVRDMGNNNEVLDSLVQKIESGQLAGPRITRLGFIEGKSPFNSNNGILVESEEEAIAAVETYAERGFYGVKLYNSMNGDWAPAIAKRAKELDLFVCGHVPAFSNANAMLRAGYDEMTHINQVMLGWVLEPEEDTRSLLRLTAMKRFPSLDLSSEKVKETLDLMVDNNAAIDPTLSIHEALMLSRNGELQQGTVDYIENMPANVQRDAKVALASIADDEEDKAYRQAYEKIVETLKLMKKRGILIVPGTDMGGAFYVHRELELYEELGYTPAELLKLGSYDMANYLGHKDRGEIAPGKLADFFLVPGNPVEDIKAIKTISMVSRGGVIYFPSEVYPAFGITPFTEIPEVK
ncbi:MAG: amidohydrolase family protein [Ekhidna sp.]